MDVQEKLLTINNYSRPGIKLNSVKGVVVHWVANPKSTALQNRNFFENRKSGNSGYGSAQYIIDLNGLIIRCIPENEMSYNVGSKTYTTDALNRLGNYPNNCTIGIECTHLDWNGVMTTETYNALVELCADLCKRYRLNPLTDLWLHKEVVGWKDCHKWFVNNPNEWIAFKQKVRYQISGGNMTMADLDELKKSLKIPDTSWAGPEIQKALSRGLINTPHDPNEIVTFGTYITIANRLMDEIEKLKNR